MAEELRWEMLFTFAIVDTDAYGEFRNDTSGDIFVRSLDLDQVTSLDVSSTADHTGQLQVSKSNTIDRNNNSTIFQQSVFSTIRFDDTATLANAFAVQGSKSKLFAKGQLILEPGESLFGHVEYSNAPTEAKSLIEIGYHF